MVEFYTALAGEQLNYEGLFSMKEIFRLIDTYYRTKGFDKKILFDEEYHTEKGKYIHIKTEYYKRMTNYNRLQTRLWIYAMDLNEVETEVEGKKVKIDQGKLSITFDAFLQTDAYKQFGDTVGWKFLFRVFYEQYIVPHRIEYWLEVARHVIDELKTEISGYLNLNKLMYER